jgi:hypothetical protein
MKKNDFIFNNNLFLIKLNSTLKKNIQFIYFVIYEKKINIL